MKFTNEVRLSDSVTLAEVEKFPDDLYREQLSSWLISEYPFLRWDAKLADDQRINLDRLKANFAQNLKLRVGLFVNGALKGWSFGWQDTVDSFYMGASAVAPEFRRLGYYTHLVNYVLNKTKELGFQTVSSNHILTNNSVIIAKLKLGFTIKSIEVDAVHGTLLRLNFHHNQMMKAAAKFRAGAVHEPGVLENLRSIR